MAEGNKEHIAIKPDQGRSERSGHVKRDGYSDIIRKNVFTYFNLINTVLFIVILLTGKPINGLFYLTVIINSSIGIFQEIRAKRMLDRLRIMIEAVYEVQRDGKWISLPSRELKTEDLVRLQAGMQVPADAVIVSGTLELNESMLTGEADAVVKKEENHIYSGTVITAGEAEVRVLRTGDECLSARILEDARNAVRTGSQLRNDMDRLIKIVSVLILPAGIILFLAQHLLVGMSWQEAALKTTAAAVGMIPEGLIVLTSIALAVGSVRLSRQKVLVQDLYAIETLARTDIVCLDKTGTITEGKMQAAGIVTLNDTDPAEFGKIMKRYLGCMKAGNMTSEALEGYFGREENPEPVEVLPFSSDRKYSAVCFGKEGTWYLGSPENLFPQRPASLDCIDEYVREGNRVIVLARSSLQEIPEKVPDDLTPAGIILITDILRKNVKEIMAYFTRQGITLYVISGDNPGTVSALAQRAGIPEAEKYLDLSVVPSDPDFFAKAAAGYRVFGRVMPADKKNLIETLHRQGHCVAMTGDGVNDVSALNTADIGISFSSAAQAARDSADVVLLSDDFGQLPSVINEGRRVINNIGRASSMYLVKTVFSVLLVCYAVLLRQDYPFLPIQLTLISSFGVGIPTFFMQMEPSFEKEEGQFLAKAFRNAVPSSVTVLFAVLYCLFTRNTFMLSAERYYGQVVVLTFAVYVVTLLRVCRPLTKWRLIIILSVTAGASFMIFFFPELFSIYLTRQDLLMILPAAALILPCIKLNEIVYDKYIYRRDWKNHG